MRKEEERWEMGEERREMGEERWEKEKKKKRKRKRKDFPPGMTIAGSLSPIVAKIL